MPPQLEPKTLEPAEPHCLVMDPSPAQQQGTAEEARGERQVAAAQKKKFTGGCEETS